MTEIVREASPSEIRVLSELQRKMNEAQEDFQRTFEAFSPAPDCRLESGRWVRDPAPPEGGPTAAD